MKECINHSNSKALYRCKICSKPICSLCFNKIQYNDGKMNHGFCSEKCQTEYLNQIKLSRKEHLPKVISELLKGVFFTVVAIFLLFYNGKLYRIKDSSELNYYLYITIFIGGFGIFKFWNVMKSYKSGFRTLGGTSFNTGQSSSDKEIDDKRLPKVKKGEFHQEKESEVNAFNGESKDTSDSLAPAILCDRLDQKEIISGINEFENLMAGDCNSDKSRVEIHIYKKETVSLLKFTPTIHPYMFYNMMDYFDASSSLGFLELQGESYMLKNNNEEEFLIAVSKRGAVLEISKVDGTVMLQMKMEFPKLTVRENLGEENAKKKTVHG